jgi:nicotinamide-nucleotide amidase
VSGASITDPVDQLVGSVVQRLIRRHETCAIAESLTAGLVIERFGRVAGVSAVLRGGVVAYASDLKTTLLDVPPTTIADHGVVSEETAMAMASGVRARCHSDWGLATTGVAGPDWQEGKPPGTVFVAIAGPAGGQCRERRPADFPIAGRTDVEARTAVRTSTMQAVLELLSDTVGSA